MTESICSTVVHDNARCRQIFTLLEFFHGAEGRGKNQMGRHHIVSPIASFQKILYFL